MSTVNLNKSLEIDSQSALQVCVLPDDAEGCPILDVSNAAQARRPNSEATQ